MWYTVEYTTSLSAMRGFVSGCLSLFSQTLAAMMGQHIFALFLAALLMAVVLGIVRMLFRTAKRGATR